MPGTCAAAKLNEEQERGEVTLAALYVAWRERLSMSVDAETVAGEQPEHLRAYFMERLQHYRQLSEQLPEKMPRNMPEKKMRLKSSVSPEAFCLSLA